MPEQGGPRRLILVSRVTRIGREHDEASNRVAAPSKPEDVVPMGDDSEVFLKNSLGGALCCAKKGPVRRTARKNLQYLLMFAQYGSIMRDTAPPAFCGR